MFIVLNILSRYIYILYIKIIIFQWEEYFAYRITMLQTLILESPKFSKTLLSILADFNSTVVWIVKFLPLISSFSILFSRFFGSVPELPTIIGITVIL